MKNIVSFFHRSNLAAKELENQQKSKGGETLKIIPEVVTRWNSTYAMIERFLNLKDVNFVVLQNVNNDLEILSSNDLKILKDGFSILKPFMQVTNEMSAEQQTTISKVIPFLGILANSLQKQTPITDAGKQLKIIILKTMEERFKSIESTLYNSVSTFLDPRFKKADFKRRTACANAINFINKDLWKMPSIKLTKMNLLNILMMMTFGRTEKLK